MRILRIKDNIPIQSNTDILSSPYIFQYHWTNVDNTYINFNQSYLDLTVKATVTDKAGPVSVYLDETGTSVSFTYDQLCQYFLDQLVQKANIYSIIDSTDVEMVYTLPDGSDRALKYEENCTHASRGRKMILLKDISKNDLEKSMYGEDLSADTYELNSIRYIRAHPNESIHIAIPLYLISGLGVDGDSLILTKHFNMLFRTSTIESLIDNNMSIYFKNGGAKLSTQWLHLTDEKWFKTFELESATMNLMTYKDIQFQTNELYKTIPTCIQVDYQNTRITSDHFNINRALPFIPEYILFWFTNGYSSTTISNVASPSVWPKYQSCLIGDVQMFPQTEFPTQMYYHNLTTKGHVFNNEETASLSCPNKNLYCLWADNSNPETILKYDEWIKHPIYIIPTKALMNIQSDSGIEMNFDCNLDVHDIEYGHADSSTVPDGYTCTYNETTKIWTPDTGASYSVASHAGIYKHINTELNEKHPYTLHMIAVRSVRDI
ncbi:hypothetical protein WA158_000664 [Blastocystis sp. Blastoise]